MSEYTPEQDMEALLRIIRAAREVQRRIDAGEMPGIDLTDLSDEDFIKAMGISPDVL